MSSSPSFRACLEAIYSSNDIMLFQERSQRNHRRPNLSLDSSSYALQQVQYLGRSVNSYTNIADNRISRHVCSVTWNEGAITRFYQNKKLAPLLTVVGAKADSKFYVNGMIVTSCFIPTNLKHGDVIALGFDSDTGRCIYEYKVIIEQCDNGNSETLSGGNKRKFSTFAQPTPSPGSSYNNRDANTIAAATTAAATTTIDTDTAAAAANAITTAEGGSNTVPHAAAADTATSRAIGEELICAVCLDIQIQCALLVPCGHSFCKQCCRNSKTCPICQAPVQTTVPNRVADRIIETACRSGDNANNTAGACDSPFFEADDVNTYRQRTNKKSLRLRSRKSATRKPRQRNQARIRRNHFSSGGTSAADAICID